MAEKDLLIIFPLWMILGFVVMILFKIPQEKE